MYYRYDVRGLLEYARFGSDSGQGITNTYDGFERLRLQRSTLGGVTRDVAWDYEANVNRRTITHPDGATFEYAYDDADQLIYLSENGPSTTLASIFYDAGRRDWLARDAQGATTDYAYDPISRLEVLTHELDGAGTGNDVGFGFAYNPASQIRTRVLTNEGYEFPLSPSVKSYAVNGRNRYTQVGGVTHAWDANGNLTDDGPTSFGYDTENRLVSASGAKTGSLAYDPLGRLWEASTSSGVTRFVYDGDRLIAEYSSSGTLLRRYVHGAGVDEPLLWYEGSSVAAGNRRYLHADHQGSIVAASNASGAMQQIHAYDAYGVTGAGNTLRFQYTGQAAIPELGLLYYKARFYNPGLGRFMQTDPIGYDDDMNLYAYVGNDPLNGTDPTGTESCTGSRVGAGCDFVQGSEQRNSLMLGSRAHSSDDDSVAQRQPLPRLDSGPGEAAARASEAILNDPNISDETKQELAIAAASVMVTVGTLGMAPEIAAAGTAIKQGASSLGRSLFGKGALLNRGANLRIGIGREGGRRTFRVAGSWLGKLPPGIRERLGIKEIKEGVYKWDLWDRGPL